jgi:hypothetical protein
VHRIPRDVPKGKTKEEAIRANLAEKKLQYEKLEPILNRTQLGSVYDDVYQAKITNPVTGREELSIPPEAYEAKVLHDANCLKNLECTGSSPYELPKLFITCDFKLARVRKKRDIYNFVITIKEFNEFMLPYLLLSDAVEKNPIETPRFLLASALSMELADTKKLEAIAGEFLIKSKKVPHDYAILGLEENKKRFEETRAKYEEAKESDSKVEWEQIISKFSEVSSAYKETVRRAIADPLLGSELARRDKQIDELQKKIQAIERQNEMYKRKQRRRQKYEKKHGRISHQ